MKTDNSWGVGKIAERAGVKISTLHYYEQQGLISSVRNSGNQRRYKKEVLRRIGVIKAAQQLGISLKEIKQALDLLPNKRTPTQEDWKKLSKQWKKSLDGRITAMTKLRDSLDGCIGCGCLSMKNCPIYNPEDKLGKNKKGAVILSSSNDNE